MGTGFLHATSRFRLVSLLIIFILIFSFSTSKVDAYSWFTVKGAGVLSGEPSGGPSIINTIPDSGHTGFESDTVQHAGSSGSPIYGTLVSSSTQNIQLTPSGNTHDPYAQSTGIGYVSPAILPIIGSGFTKIVITNNCSSMLDSISPLGSTNIIYETNATCFESAVNSVPVTKSYNVSSDGLTLIFVNKEVGNPELNILRRVVSAGGDKRRIMVITDARVRIDSGVVIPTPLPPYTPDSVPDIQMSIFTFDDTNNDNFIVDTAGTPVVLEGPIVAGRNVILGRELGVNAFPGVYVKYNPFYVIELSKRNVDGLGIANLFKSKTIWRYE